jgi:glutaredoxin
MNKSMTSLTRLLPIALSAGALFATTASHAQYKVVSPDGKVTYTDTPPPSSSGNKVSKLGQNISVIPQVALPLELRTATTKYPVTLYSMKVCEPCDAARQLLKQRGVPFAEKMVLTGEDGDALQRISGGRDAPTLTIGSQVLRGLSASTWNSYLDSAGYPRESMLPANYQFPAATPLTTPPAPRVAAQPPAPAPTPSERPIESPLPGGIRF